jgi:predicted AAA+ superfamily ATPase
MIETDGIRFILSGSSARSLRRKGVNLLAGRAHAFYLHPLTTAEMGDSFDLLRVLNYGSIPSVYLSDDPQAELEAYVGTYLAEEIAFEGLTRKLPQFSRFLEVAALCSGEQVNFTTLASDVQVKRNTVIDWFDILYDTLIAAPLPIWCGSQKRKPAAAQKFYFFDIGVVHHLMHVSEQHSLKSSFTGKALEHWVYQELKASCDYKVHKSLHTWRTTQHIEVDFILDNTWAIEVKAKNHITAADLKGLKALVEENLCERYTVVYLGEHRQLIEDKIEAIPFREFVAEVWAGKILI